MTPFCFRRLTRGMLSPPTSNFGSQQVSQAPRVAPLTIVALVVNLVSVEGCAAAIAAKVNARHICDQEGLRAEANK